MTQLQKPAAGAAWGHGAAWELPCQRERATPALQAPDVPLSDRECHKQSRKFVQNTKMKFLTIS